MSIFETSEPLHGNDPARQQAGAARTVTPDSDAVAEALVTLVADAAHREALGTQAREAALAEYDRDRMARAYEALYDAVTRG